MKILYPSQEFCPYDLQRILKGGTMSSYRWIFAFIFMIVLGSTNAYSRDLTYDEKLSDFNQTVSMIRSGYGPLLFKKEIMKLDLDKIADAYRERIKETKTNGQFYYLIVEFIAEFQDTHFSANVPTTHTSMVPFYTDLVDGKVLIDVIDRTRLSEADFPFKKGDEVLAVDGEDIQSLVNRLALRRGMGFELSAKRYGAMAVTVRPGTIFEVPTGVSKFKIRKGTSEEIQEVSVKWIERGQVIDESFFLFAASGRNRTNYDRIALDEMPRFERDFRCSGGTRIEIPKDATIIMKTPEAPFVAYYYPTAKGNVGYLRIPHYSPVNEKTGATEFTERLEQYKYAVSVLEKNTVGLIIDQDHNCGGSVEFLNKLLGLFVHEAYKPMQFTLLANKEEYISFQDWLTQETPFTLDKANVEKVLGLVRTAWKAGEFMTPMTSIDGSEYRAPNSVQYTKPIVMLIDEMSGSGGDAFPAYMKGYGRATLLGTRTMGAGGHVEVQQPLYYSRITFRMTKSLFYRPDGVPVENNGAVPDINYTITRDDFVGGYKNYQKFYTEKLLEKVQ